ncbi:PIN domain-containing protein [Acinetobacter haemolyticus]|uniref:PIN domain-containing protein n=1 Tax=Acinetobacter haemolyticus TaxID=29430 RepID=UPI002A6A7EA1|nr:PIN domain-containing protein [Acinetobacter haemolyticus]WPO66978.1 PIN domain-containing protein [Acinetobacter haemolyticus]
MKKVLLLDIENIHKTEKELLQLLKTYACVYLVYAKSPVTLSLDALIKFSPFVMDKKLVVIKMPKIGKDAADFGLAFLAGQLSIQMDKNQTCFDIMSNDGALEYIVDLLRIMGFKASQLKMLAEVKEVEKIKEQPSPVLAQNNLSDSDFALKLKHLISILSKLKNMPSNEKALLNGVKSWANVTTKEAEKLIKALMNFKMIKFSAQGITLNRENLKTFLNKSEIAHNESPNESEIIEEIPAIQDISEKFHLRQIKEYCDYLIKQQGKPSSLSSLNNSIKSVLKLESDSLVKNRFKLLLRYSIVKNLDNEKIIYIDKNIRRWSSLELLPQHPPMDMVIPDFELCQKESKEKLIQKIIYVLNEIKIQKSFVMKTSNNFYLEEM